MFTDKSFLYKPWSTRLYSLLHSIIESKNSEFLALFWLDEETLGIGWKLPVLGS